MKISKILLSVAVAFSLGNAITLTPDDEAMINDNKKIISELKNINSDSEIFNRTISGVIKAKEEMIKLKLESKGEDYVERGISMLSKESNDAFMFGIREALEKRDIVGFEALIKGYMSLSSNPDENYTYSDEFLDIMIQNKDIQAFKILKNLNFDKFEVIGSETADSTDFIQYLNRQKADKEILKIFK